MAFLLQANAYRTTVFVIFILQSLPYGLNYDNKENARKLFAFNLRLSLQHIVYLRSLIGIIRISRTLKTLYMKILFTISAIILISFQTTSFIKHSDSNMMRSEVKLLSGNYITKEDLPVVDSSVYRSPKSIKKENTVARKAVAGSSVVSKASHNTKHVAVSKTIKRNYTVQANNNNIMLHRLVKESSGYKAFTMLQFDFNKHQVGTKEFNTILQYADQLIFDRNLKISVAGFSDNVGTVEANEHISWLRAATVKNYLLELGVDEDQIIVSANGIDDPVAGNTTEFGRLMNRRVEMALVQYQ